MTEHKTVSSPDSARRKLVRGTFAAPAVLTLQCGSAFAAVSTTSLARQAQLQQVVPTTAADDTYFRYHLWALRKNSGDIISAWIQGDDLTFFKKSGQVPFVPPGSWWQFDPASNLLVGALTTTAPSPNPGSQTFLQDGPWVGLKVSTLGALVGAGASSPNGLLGGVVNDSVWNSFALATV